MTTQPTTLTGTTDAWAFVLRHQSMIRAYCHRWFRVLPPSEREDATQAAILRIVERHPSLRLDGAKNPKAVISTWLGYQVRASLTTARKRVAKQEREGVGRLVEVGGALSISTGHNRDNDEPTGRPLLGPGHLEPDARVLDADALAQIEAFWFVATDRQRAAMRSHMERDNAAAAKARGFRTLRERDAILRSLAQSPAAEA